MSSISGRGEGSTSSGATSMPLYPASSWSNSGSSACTSTAGRHSGVHDSGRQRVKAMTARSQVGQELEVMIALLLQTLLRNPIRCCMVWVDVTLDVTQPKEDRHVGRAHRAIWSIAFDGRLLKPLPMPRSPFFRQCSAQSPVLARSIA